MGNKGATCIECGARLEAEGTQCTLCGWRAGIADISALSGSAADEAAFESRPVFCNACRWENPAGSRFCAQCGARLQEMVPKAQPPVQPPVHQSDPASAPAAVTGMPAGQVAVVVVAALVLVVALYLVTVESKRTHPRAAAEASPPTAFEAAPVSGPLAEQLAALDAEIQSDTGLARLTRQREKAYVLMQSDRLDLAAMEYQRIAESTGSVEDWRIAGDLFYDWMSEEEDVNSRAQIAASAIAAYEFVLQIQPDNLGVRTDLATAYLNTGNPMRGVAEIKRVLEADSTHLDANFNYGLMLWRIGRTDQAATQFEKVMALADNPSAHYSRASEALRTLQQQGPL